MRRPTRMLSVVLMTVLLAISEGCTTGDESPVGRLVGGPTAPTAPPAPPAAPATPAAPTLSRIAVTGNVSFTSIGQTSQLTVTATFSDETTKDVTNEATASAADVKVAQVSSSGLVTTVGYGSSLIIFRYSTRASSVTVTVTPVNTFIIGGRVREPGQSGLPDVRVTDLASGRSTMSTSEGTFSIGQLPRAQARFRFEKSTYEPVEMDVTTASVDAPMQQVIRLTAGEKITPRQLAPNDLFYVVGTERCTPCRLFRVVVPASGTLGVRVIAAQTPRFRLHILANGQVFAGETREASAELSISAPGEVVMYFGGLNATMLGYTPITIETTLR